ncbi:MAG: putative hydroxymethylpyrimidine transporter CytX [Eubacteriales bacterium]|nr:putative hydroxymethylpyrimidine transporter CytX [Eubacteriales bacterium]
MENKRTSVFENGLIWFGAGVSIAEMLTGTYFAPLGFKNGILAILLGHLIGGCMFLLAGLIGGLTRKSSMETVKLSFGEHGGQIFAVLNIIQLVAWTAIMIYDGANSAEGALAAGRWIWCAVIGGLIIVWTLVGITNLGKINTVAMAALFVLTLVLCKVIFFGNSGSAVGSADSMSFGAAVELAVSMPLSWLPVISDYTREAEKPVQATWVSTIVYSVISTWMFVIGMGAAIYAGTDDIASIMVKAGLGVVGLIIIVLSTVTTAFLDAWSAGISSESLSSKISGKWVAVAAGAIGIAASILFPMDDITGFLYLIGSVFAPMTAVMITDYFIVHYSAEDKSADWVGLIVWLIGFVLYRLLMKVDIPVGNTLPDMAITMLITLAARKIFSAKRS